MSKYMATLSITEIENRWKLIILYLVMMIPTLCLLMSDNMITNHVGLILIAVMLALVCGALYRYSTNTKTALIITCAIFALATLFVYKSDESKLKSYSKWTTPLLFIALTFVVIQLLYMIFFGPNETLNNVINGIIVLLFVGIIISDTSKLLVDSKIEMCPDHACINYPLKASSLALDVANIFVRLTDAR